jgi:hypothetical protein
MTGKKAKPQKPIRVARKSGDGRFTTEEYARKHPKTTEIETYKRPSPKRRKTS